MINHAVLTAKSLRMGIVAISFLSLMFIMGMDIREAQQYLFSLGVICLFAMVVRNLWLTLFIWLTVVLFTYHKFETGSIYIANLTYGAMLYYLTKLAFKKEHISFFINGFIWLVVINLGYIVLQLINWDPLFLTVHQTSWGHKGTLPWTDPAGFMGFKAGMGMFMAMAVPIFLARRKLAYDIGAIGLAAPLYISCSSIAWAGAIIGGLFVLWYRLKRWVWYVLLAVLVLCGTAYVKYVDAPMGMMGDRIYLWKLVIADAKCHPISGWGIDSFRNTTSLKKHVYIMDAQINENKQMSASLWDNEHNLYVSLLFGWGILALLLLGCYIRQIVISFSRSFKTENNLALTGFILVFFIVSIAQFPIFLARMACFIVPMFALLETSLEVTDADITG